MKKSLAALLTFAMLLSSVVIATASVSAQSDAWDGSTVAESFSSGSGTAEDPYIIMTGAELYKLSVDAFAGDLYSGVHFKLGDDINLGGNLWVSIGRSSSTPFSGSLDGNGKTIYNFEVLDMPAGLFGIMADNYVKDLKIDYAKIINASSNITGALAAKTMRSTIENIEIGKNVVVGNAISATNTPQVGGVIGLIANESVAKNLIFRGRIEIVTCGKNANGWAGGIIGMLGSASTVDGAINYGDIIYTDAEPIGNIFMAGIVGGTGNDTNPGTFKNAINYGSITSVNYASGIVGRFGGGDGVTLENCFNASANIVAGKNSDGASMASLLLGYAAFDGTLKNCYSVACGDTPLYVRITDDSGKEHSIGDSTQFGSAVTVDELSFSTEFQAILNTVPAAMPTWNEVTVEEAPDVSETVNPGTDSEPVDSGSEPEDTGSEPVDTPEDTSDKTEPTTPVVTDPVAPETEKPAEGGCGSVVAGGLAILAVVTLAGVAPKKRD